ncbi:MAG: cob(I)yrinic acid a,c-diamide adenosyltransferase [Alphaproteobacteria bacterium]|jgi:cob(I)alamin adenosyltransferase|nr:cob(I)yrinic acid a,c-diamide adenosyltransferase [Rhodospirillaceae bacterium]MDG2479564.1 cob(I)yrinic acid a,c-diamide adenosyltransferase [Alphaproteobacteria bacterium]MBT6204308.1 cob(I)yrinic acid a,c-diamide adenosyltransferase [Rhodospirillaceae bacterium]MBT6510868.1 cob(I)yrinic acid a,c-diamide adenosyltransferase [Rhodospirillaceae bacterium]MBT7615552.1 cob(I)yrinic acid a,c-diamide adenosyltransferase [Rhodospirillaceae bacterium]
MSETENGEPEAGEEFNDRHREKMKKRKAARDKMMASKTEERGLIIVHTGKGKGKSSAAWGMALRCIGHGFKIGVVQFIKGRSETGETKLFALFPDQVTHKIMGEGFTWETQDRERDVAAATAAWEESKAMMAYPEIHMVILDELNIALRYDYVDLDDVLDTLATKRTDLHVVITGRNAKPELIDLADLVTEMTLIKHPFREGVRGQIGVEF